MLTHRFSFVANERWKGVEPDWQSLMVALLTLVSWRETESGADDLSFAGYANNRGLRRDPLSSQIPPGSIACPVPLRLCWPPQCWFLPGPIQLISSQGPCWPVRISCRAQEAELSQQKGRKEKQKQNSHPRTHFPGSLVVLGARSCLKSPRAYEWKGNNHMHSREGLESSRGGRRSRSRTHQVAALSSGQPCMEMD